MGEFRTNQAWLQGWEVETLRLSQLEDPAMGPLLTSKEMENSKPSWRDISHLSGSFKYLWAQWDHLEVRSGLLFRWTYSDKTGRSRLQLLVPETKHREVFQHLHEHCIAGLLGTEKTREKRQFAFYWPGRPKTVKDMCRKCDKCAARKLSLKRHRAPLPSGKPHGKDRSGYSWPLAKDSKREYLNCGPGRLLHKVDGGICCSKSGSRNSGYSASGAIRLQIWSPKAASHRLGNQLWKRSFPTGLQTTGHRQNPHHQ